ncbi:malate synthase A [Rapidithrix thailandica]|uniref:Malate synthase n=1 Tax=Rapidithrix thailandica TaxID=413964 RepID=A0AAW9SC40_9BACT
MEPTETLCYPTLEELEVKGKYTEAFAEILTKEALQFLIALHQEFNNKRKNLLLKRQARQEAIDQGTLPDFLPETQAIREADWKVAPLPADLLDRRVEITGPVERKMVINALNSGAKVFMADFEDSNTPTWDNTINGQLNLRDANLRTITFTQPGNGKSYQLNPKTATLMVRPRGWHLEEKHLCYKGEPMSASLVDFGLYLFHNTRILFDRGSGPYFYLPKLESHLEARLWNEVFVFSQNYLSIPQKSIKATVLIETLLATFELHEILYELRDHSAGLNCGRWDYIFSYIKKFRKLPGRILPDRSKVTMTVPFMSAYSQLVIQTCHRRGVHAIGGMAAFIPIKNDPEANAQALDKVRKDKLLEAKNGHDGTWVAHPGLVKIAMDVFDKYMPEKNQIQNLREDFHTSASQLIEVPEGTVSEQGIRMNINVGILYIESWLRGTGAAAIYNLMEDAATAEISRTQVWQWLHAQIQLEDGRTFTQELYETLLNEEVESIQTMLGEENYEQGRFPEAIQLFDRLVKDQALREFLTLPAYKLID